MPFVFIILGIVFIGIGIFMLVPNQEVVKPAVQPIAPKQEVVQQPKAEMPLVPASPAAATSSPAPKTEEQQYEENKAKGDAFEKYVVQQFNPKYFSLHEWRSDKYVNGRYAISNHFPDLEIQFNLKDTHDKFAVECKWRKGFYQNELVLAKDYQVDNYKKYATEIGLPVFLIIGLGGTPDNPENVYVLPLSKLKANTIGQEEIKAYHKTGKPTFYWDEEKKQLK